ncbi:MAG: ATP-dependent sacrificial sulfur transferase LarE [Bacillota bacterium]|nr:ATP-dependent sacrificial sulfur transferase LarE [Bacillota bacterium]
MSINPLEVDEKWQTLLRLLTQRAGQGLALAFSGGVDSSLLAYAARRSLDGRVTAVYFRTPLQSAADHRQAESMAAEIGCRLMVVREQPLALAPVAANQRARCYYCKRLLLGRLRSVADSLSVASIADGSNADDALSPRPGNRAAQELGVWRPLAEAGLNKEEVRYLARRAGLSNWQTPAHPCLASRFPYDTPLDEEQLRRVEEAEEYIATLGLGEEFRLRAHGELCRLELQPQYIAQAAARAEELSACLRELGYKYATLDLQGFYSGSMDR